MPEKDYSATPLPKKLGIKEGSSVIVLGRHGFEKRLGPLPEGARVGTRIHKGTDVILLFITEARRLSKRFATLAEELHLSGGLWIAWPKKSSTIESDLTFEEVQRIGLDAGLVDNKSCSIDENWQALRFVYRLKDR